MSRAARAFVAGYFIGLAVACASAWFVNALS
jgi:hypothetical protein